MDETSTMHILWGDRMEKLAKSVPTANVASASAPDSCDASRSDEESEAGEAPQMLAGTSETSSAASGLGANKKRKPSLDASSSAVSSKKQKASH